MKKQIKHYSAEEKAKVAIEALKGGGNDGINQQ